MELRIPRHGRGRLLVGGMPGNKGGGRPPCQIKALCRQGFAEAVAGATKLAKGDRINENTPKPSNADMIRALGVLGRYGFAETETVVPEEIAQAVANVLNAHLPTDRVVAAIDALVKRLEECPELFLDEALDQEPEPQEEEPPQETA